MTPCAFARTHAGALAFALVAGSFVIVSAIDPGQSRNAEAQTESSVTAIQTPPPVPGIDYEAALTEAAPVASPVAVADADSAAPDDVQAGETTLAEDNGGYSTSLGGSDVAVASEGGSHQVDGPKRRLDRLPKPEPRP